MKRPVALLLFFSACLFALPVFAASPSFPASPADLPNTLLAAASRLGQPGKNFHAIDYPQGGVVVTVLPGYHIAGIPGQDGKLAKIAATYTPELTSGGADPFYGICRLLLETVAPGATEGEAMLVFIDSGLASQEQKTTSFKGITFFYKQDAKRSYFYAERRP